MIFVPVMFINNSYSDNYFWLALNDDGVIVDDSIHVEFDCKISRHSHSIIRTHSIIRNGKMIW